MLKGSHVVRVSIKYKLDFFRKLRYICDVQMYLVDGFYTMKIIDNQQNDIGSESVETAEEDLLNRGLP